MALTHKSSCPACSSSCTAAIGVTMPNYLVSFSHKSELLLNTTFMKCMSSGAI